ncbi:MULTISPECIES: polyprenyl synthetase family protein [Streptomyces]|uniref:polyprenyl synthetase family protein n=1 Tax=Streptomyces lycopersici TaxID=2974589 RepID=UPI0021D3C319|nr:polyprenyl synthetase family protein [Streptomyces sp. NEAU-383]
MAGPVTSGRSIDLAALRRRVDAALAEFLTDRQDRATATGHPHVAAAVLREFLGAGGKRVRPLLCMVGWHAAGGHGSRAPAERVAAALEMFHAFALIHDDIMDRSSTRRGVATVHTAMTARFARHHPAPTAEHLGRCIAMLVGDLALSWSYELVHTAGLSADQLGRVLPTMHTMHTEVMHGQYLDLISTARQDCDAPDPFTVIHYKTAAYTFERPLHIGAALAGAGQNILDACTAWALPVGEAFQLRDDLLGVFGPEQSTGKSVLDDLREGKHTVLLCLALGRADRHGGDILRTLVGRPDLTEEEAARIREVLVATGARQAVEEMICDRSNAAREALDHAPLPARVREALHAIARAATDRTT